MSNPPERPRVVYWNNIPAPYMVDRFNAVADLGSLDFEAWFNDRTESDRSWRVEEQGWRFAYRYLPSATLGPLRLRFAQPAWACPRDTLIVSLYAEPVFVSGWAMARLRGLQTAFWAQVTFDSWVTRRWWKNAIKRHMFSRVDASFGHGEDSRQFAMASGTPAAKARTLPHSIDVEFFRQRSDAARPQREQLRAELGLRGVTFIYVGRLVDGKGLDTCIAAFAEFRRQWAGDASLLLVGDGVAEAALRAQVQALGVEGVLLPGFRHKEDLPALYAASDVFLFPTLGDPYGLVVDEAMACRLPLLSTTAAGEIGERVKPGRNGLLVAPGSVAEMAAAMAELAAQQARFAAMGELSWKLVEGRTPAAWARCFEQRVLALKQERLAAARG